MTTFNDMFWPNMNGPIPTSHLHCSSSTVVQCCKRYSGSVPPKTVVENPEPSCWSQLIHLLIQAKMWGGEEWKEAVIGLGRMGQWLGEGDGQVRSRKRCIWWQDVMCCHYSHLCLLSVGEVRARWSRWASHYPPSSSPGWLPPYREQAKMRVVAAHHILHFHCKQVVELQEEAVAEWFCSDFSFLWAISRIAQFCILVCSTRRKRGQNPLPSSFYLEVCRLLFLALVLSSFNKQGEWSMLGSTPIMLHQSYLFQQGWWEEARGKKNIRRSGEAPHCSALTLFANPAEQARRRESTSLVVGPVCPKRSGCKVWRWVPHS